MNTSDTIVAISSAVGAAARIIIRISGADAHRIAGELLTAPSPFTAAPNALTHAKIYPGVTAWLYTFTAPKSYTGEHLVECHIPGSPIVARMLLDRIVQCGARQAEPGEFTARAYFNGRIDLTQAEGVAATIEAHSQRELRAARQLLSGELARRLSPVMDAIAQALALIEVGIDFSDEDVTFLSADEVHQRCTTAKTELESILNQSARFERLTHEPRIVLVGRPNAGKSTLLNALAGQDRAVVSNVAGTTRDAIWAEVKLPRGVVKIVDVAGIESVGSGQTSASSVESSAAGSAEESIARQMHQQAIREVETADIIALVEDATIVSEPLSLPRSPDLAVKTKTDLLDENTIPNRTTGILPVHNDSALNTPAPSHTNSHGQDARDTIYISAKTNQGLDTLRTHLDTLAFGPQTGSGLALNTRHVAALSQAIDSLTRAADSIAAGPEIVALELRETLDALGSILGKISPDDLLGRVFSQFCIGK